MPESSISTADEKYFFNGQDGLIPIRESANGSIVMLLPQKGLKIKSESPLWEAQIPGNPPIKGECLLELVSGISSTGDTISLPIESLRSIEITKVNPKSSFSDPIAHIRERNQFQRTIMVTADEESFAFEGLVFCDHYLSPEYEGYIYSHKDWDRYWRQDRELELFTDKSSSHKGSLVDKFSSDKISLKEASEIVIDQADTDERGRVSIFVRLNNAKEYRGYLKTTIDSTTKALSSGDAFIGATPYGFRAIPLASYRRISLTLKQEDSTGSSNPISPKQMSPREGLNRVLEIPKTPLEDQSQMERFEDRENAFSFSYPKTTDWIMSVSPKITLPARVGFINAKIKASMAFGVIQLPSAVPELSAPGIREAATQNIFGAYKGKSQKANLLSSRLIKNPRSGRNGLEILYVDDIKGEQWMGKHISFFEGAKRYDITCMALMKSFNKADSEFFGVILDSYEFR
jgi:hypothetical protein